ncbi:MAG TPA: hypothetical protein VM934_11295 [Pyrinomonadaceae bacterium]|jgi:rubrerythrin|nr:hypothetical protein [Pyrinomonadaceae bacterium]
MTETQNFVNDGFGWTCRSCRATCDSNASDENASDEKVLARFFREGEAEEREPRLSTPSLARWKDEPGHTLVCPRCGIEESLSA